MADKCGHCNGTGACDCSACNSGKSLGSSSPKSLGEKYVNYHGGNSSRVYHECSKCDGTGVLQTLTNDCVHCKTHGVCNCNACSKTMPMSFRTDWSKIEKKGYVDYKDAKRNKYNDINWHICSICGGAGKQKNNITNIELVSDSSGKPISDETYNAIINKLKEEKIVIAKNIELSEKRHLEYKAQIQLEMEKQKTEILKQKKKRGFFKG